MSSVLNFMSSNGLGVGSGLGHGHSHNTHGLGHGHNSQHAHGGHQGHGPGPGHNGLNNFSGPGLNDSDSQLYIRQIIDHEASFSSKKTLWYCELCNYKTEYASNLRIHSKSDKHRLALQHKLQKDQSEDSNVGKLRLGFGKISLEISQK